MEIHTISNSFSPKNKEFVSNENSQNHNSIATKNEEQSVSLEISQETQKLLAKESMIHTTKNNALAQTLVTYIQNDERSKINNELKNIDLESIGLKDTDLFRLTQNEATMLTNNDGILSQESTMQRVIDHALDLAQNNLEFFHEIREGLIEGFEKAEEHLQNELSSLAYQTQYQTLEALNQTIMEFEKKGV